jgi:hypothetical protein
LRKFMRESLSEAVVQYNPNEARLPLNPVGVSDNGIASKAPTVRAITGPLPKPR